MKLCKVAANHEENGDDPDRDYIVVADTPEEALDLVRARGDSEPYKQLFISGLAAGPFDRPAHVLGHTGQGPFTWK